MAEDFFRCIKCGGKMIKGFIADNTEGGNFLSKWYEGEPVHKTFFGTPAGNLEVSGKKVFKVRSLRCEKCGFLELYAV